LVPELLGSQDSVTVTAPNALRLRQLIAYL
jgi:hypothetical protein